MTKSTHLIRYAVLAALFIASPTYAQTNRLDVRLNTEAADAVLALVKKGRRATDKDWQRLLNSDGYRRLKAREAAMRRPLTDSAFKAFVMDTALARRAPRLERALKAWKKVDVNKAAEKAFAYLPANARIKATIYPSIKPRDNTFVWETKTNPAIFFYLDPDITPEQFENTLAHELHHLGVGSVCNNDNEPLAIQWMSGFAEGRAVLAAAGNPDVHPHATSSANERAIWDRDYAKAPADITRLEQFFNGLKTGALSEEEQRRGYEFVATDSVPQGAFYTVGYLMSRTIEKELGRARLIASLCDPRMFIDDYNSIAQKRNLPVWR